MTSELMLPNRDLTPVDVSRIPTAVVEAGPAAQYAWEEFFDGQIENENTKAAYLNAVKRFLSYCQDTPLVQIRPKHVSDYLKSLTDTKEKTREDKKVSASTKKLHLAAIRHFFDYQVMRHAVIINPATSVRGEKLKITEGKTVPLSTDQVNKLFNSIDRDTPVDYRDYAIIATLSFTLGRVGAVVKLRVKDFYDGGDQWYLHMDEKGGNSREIPVRHDLWRYITDYMREAEILQDDKDAPLFRNAPKGRAKWLTDKPMITLNIWYMLKRRLRDAELPTKMTPHSFRAGMATHLLEQGVPLEEVQHLLGHADPRTTKIYDHRKKVVTRNIVERISIGSRPTNVV